MNEDDQAYDSAHAEWRRETYWPDGWAEEDRTSEAMEAAWDEVTATHGAEVTRWCRVAGMSLDDALAYDIWPLHRTLSPAEVRSAMRWWQIKMPLIDALLYRSVGLTADDLEWMRPEHIELHLQHAYEDGRGLHEWRRQWRDDHPDRCRSLSHRPNSFARD